MVEILRNKNLATRFQILAEIANSGPNVQQRDIAGKLGVTPQAISDYIKQLENDGLLASSNGHATYRLTADGVNWIIKMLRDLSGYSDFILKAITNISVCAAVAGSDLREGQKVGLAMEGGVLVASAEVAGGAKGIAVSSVEAGQDVGIRDIEGIVDLRIGKITILKVPGVQKGGSKMVDTDRLRKELTGARFIGAIGIEALVALRRIDAAPGYLYGVSEAAIEAAQSGLSPCVVCVEDEISRLIKRLEDEKIDYELVSLSKEANESGV